jgi:hypothetical protein
MNGAPTNPRGRGAIHRALKSMELSPLTCKSEELYSIVSSSNRTHLMLCLSNPFITEEHILSLLRNPHITQEIVQAVNDRFSTSYKIQFGIVNCAKTPHTLAMRLLPQLFWNDLVRICENYRLFPPLRRNAENHLRDKVSGLTVGERKTLARTAPRSLIGLLKSESEPSVFTCLLQNPRLIEDDLVPLLSNEMTPVSILEAVAANRQWTNRYPVRLAIVRNDKTPLRLRLLFLSRIQKPDLQVLARTPHTAQIIRAAAERILTGEY